MNAKEASKVLGYIRDELKIELRCQQQDQWSNDRNAYAVKPILINNNINLKEKS